MKLKNHTQIKELAKFLMAIVIAYFFSLRLPML